MGAEKTEVKYRIETELSSGDVKFLPEFLKRNYLLQQENYRDFKNVGIAVENGRSFLNYRVWVPRTEQYVDVVVEVSIPIEVTMRPSDSGISKTFLDQLNEDLFLTVQLFEEEARKTTLYLAFMLGEKIVPEKNRKSVV